MPENIRHSSIIEKSSSIYPYSRHVSTYTNVTHPGKSCGAFGLDIKIIDIEPILAYDAENEIPPDI